MTETSQIPPTGPGNAELILPNPAMPIVPKWEGSLHDRASQQARRVPENLAVVDSQVTWSYAELDLLSNQLANYLRARGIQNQDIVAIYSHRSASLVWALLSILKAGAAFVILDPAYPASRLIDCLSLAQPRAWLQLEAAGELPAILDEFVASLSDCCRLKLPRSIAAARDLLAEQSTEDPLIEIEPDGVAYIAFTSGSTGKPKGIIGTHRPLSHFMKWHCETFGFNESDRFSMLSGLAHDPLLRDIFTALWLGATVILPDPNYLRSPGQLAKWMHQEKITVSHLTPAMGQLLSETTPAVSEAMPKAIADVNREIPSLRYLFFGGDVLTRQDIIDILQIAPNATCVNFYGATETPQAMAYYIIPNPNNIEEDESKDFKEKLPLGRGIDGVQLLILNGAQQLAGTGELGEIYIRTPYLAKGYLGDDERTQERFVVNPFTKIPDDRFYKTGDLGRYLSDGNIQIIGRADNQVKIRGFRIEPGEIEAVLSQYPDVLKSVVIAREDTPGEKRLVAYIVPNRDRAPTKSELRRALKERLPEYMVPSAFVMLDALPITPNGKIDRRALKAPDRLGQESEETFVAPRDELQLQLTKIWGNILGVATVSITDNFFELGGHSLLAIRLSAEIEKVIGKTLPLAAIFQAPTVEQLTKIIRSEGWVSPCPSLVVIQPGESKPALFCIHVLGKGLSYYRPLARHIGSDLPLYGLAVQVMNEQQAPPNRVEDLASYYIKEMQVLQPQGPYFLTGFSFGGIVAFEMARQLQLAGEKVALLALLDAIAPNAIQRLPRRQVISNHWNNFWQIGGGYLLEKVVEKLERLKDKLLWMYYKFCLNQGWKVPDSMGELAFLEANRLAESSYVPQVYPQQVTLLRAVNQTAQVADVAYRIEPLLGWEFLAGGLEIHDIPGDHFSMLEEPDVKVLAKKLRACIDKAGNF